jgi:polysaccharide export outer membrane protein
MQRSCKGLWKNFGHPNLNAFGVMGVAGMIALASCLSVMAAPRAESAGACPPQEGSAAENRQTSYVIQIGDQLDIKLFYNPELNEQVTVRPDGRISLQLADEVLAAGLTPEQLRESLLHIYSTQLRQPELAVIVRSFSSQKIYVDGEVGHPGLQPLGGRETVLDAISEAGGLKDSARRKQVLIIRRNGQKPPSVLTINVKELLNAKYADRNIPLEPYDVVYVPRSRIGDVNAWVSQYIRNNIPFSFGFFTSVF